MSRILLGRAVPFGRKSELGAAAFHLQIERGAFDQATLDQARDCRFNVNHTRETVTGARVNWVNTASGLYAHITLPESRSAQLVMELRHQWRGLSIEFDFDDAAAFIDWPSCTRILRRVSAIKGLSLMISSEPWFADTWLAERAEGLTRMRAEHEAALVAAWGQDYKRLPRSYWTLPLQARHIEEALCARDPDRALMIRFGELAS
jgi:phage head maturation protease